MISHIATLLTQIIIQYLPFGVTITCGIAISGIIIPLLNWCYEFMKTLVQKRFHTTDKYIIINKDNKLYKDYIKYLYKNFLSKTHGCIVDNEDKYYNLLINEKTDKELEDKYEDNKIKICFQNIEKNNNIL